MNAHSIAELLCALDDGTQDGLKQALEQGVDPVDLLQNGIIRGLERVGAKFASKEYFLSELMMAGEIAESCIELIDPYLPDDRGPARGVVVIGAVQGDLHDIGYGLVAKQLELVGFEVHSLGVNIPAMTFIDRAQETHADIIGLSAFLVSTIPNCGEVIEYLNDMGLRDQFKVIIGGAETSQEACDAMGADGWAPNASDAVGLCQVLMDDDAQSHAARR